MEYIWLASNPAHFKEVWIICFVFLSLTSFSIDLYRYYYSSTNSHQKVKTLTIQSAKKWKKRSLLLSSFLYFKKVFHLRYCRFECGSCCRNGVTFRYCGTSLESFNLYEVIVQIDLLPLSILLVLTPIKLKAVTLWVLYKLAFSFPSLQKKKWIGSLDLYHFWIMG